MGSKRASDESGCGVVFDPILVGLKQTPLTGNAGINLSRLITAVNYSVKL